MKTTSNASARQSPSGEAWWSHAADELGVGVDWSAAAVRAAFLAQLEQDDFVPPAKVPQAFEVVLATRPGADALSTPAELLDAFESALGSKIDKLVDEFFLLSVADRLKRWHQLWQDSQAFPLFLARLDRLKPGLNVDRAELKDLSPLARELGEHACRLFLLPAGQRTLECETLVDRLHADADWWPQAAKTLKRRAPKVVQLAPQFILEILKPRSRSMRARPEKADTVKEFKIPWVFVLILFSSFMTAIRTCSQMEERARKGYSPSQIYSDREIIPNGRRPSSVEGRREHQEMDLDATLKRLDEIHERKRQERSPKTSGPIPQHDFTEPAPEEPRP